MVRYIEENGEENSLTFEENGEEDSLTLQELPPMGYLALLVEGRMSQTFPLRSEVRLGREKGNAIVVADRKVSRHHAILSPIENTFIISDQGSANGTYVNGVRIAQPTRLQNNDKIGIGDATFLFTTNEPSAQVANSPPTSAAGSTPPQPIATQLPTRILTGDNRPIWAAIGCIAVAIIALLIILALILGIFVGRGGELGLALFWLAQGADVFGVMNV